MTTLTWTADEDFADRIYETSVLPDLWPGVLREFAAVAESRHACVIAVTGADYKWIGSSDVMAALTQDSYNYPGGHERTRRLLAAEPKGFISDLDLHSESELRAEPLYTKCLIPAGCGRGIATTIKLPTNDLIVFHAEGDVARGPVSAELKTRLNLLRPHLARSALVSARLAFERKRTAIETLPPSALLPAP